MAKEKIIFACRECGNEYSKWQGKCNACGEWNTIVEETKMTGKAAASLKTAITASYDETAERVPDIKRELFDGFSSGMKELDRVFGGSIVKGSVTLMAGEPGMGKSTLLTSLASYVSIHTGPVLYSSGEESKGQGKKRFEERMKLAGEDVYLLHSRNVEAVEKNVEEINPSLLIIDSIQMLADPTIASSIGSVTQVNACTARLIHLAKTEGVAIILVGQVLKDNSIAGPKQLEHMVDTVLYLEGEKYNDLRIVRVQKNRFGSNMELGVFQMAGSGMEEVTDPSLFSLSDRPKDASGSVVTCVSDVRPILVEVQALVSPPVVQGTFPKRRAYGFDVKRLDIILGVLEKRLSKHKLAYKDIIINVAGGMKIQDQPSADLAVAMAIYSSEVNQAIDGSDDTKTMIIGEVGLVGEVRPVSNVEQLVKEAERCGFTHCILPKKSYEQVKDMVKHIKLTPITKVEEAIRQLF